MAVVQCNWWKIFKEELSCLTILSRIKSHNQDNRNPDNRSPPSHTILTTSKTETPKPSTREPRKGFPFLLKGEYMKRITVLLFALTLSCALMVGCPKAAVKAAVPGSTSDLDAKAFRVIADAQAAMHSIKTWEQCSAANFPATIDVDGTAEPCDSNAGVFPPKYVPALNIAINAYNDAAVAGKAYHDSAGDPVVLQQKLDALQTSVGTLLNTTGGK